MKLKHRTQEQEKPKPSRMEPLNEGIRTTKRGRDWTAMTDDAVVSFAQRLVEEKVIRNRNGLQDADSGLYHILWQRKLLDLFGFEKTRKYRKWGNDDKVLAFVRRFIEENGILSKKGLEKADAGLYQVLRDRRLFDSVGFKENQRKWGTDGEVLGFTMKSIQEKGIRSKKGLEKADRGLYQVLRKRKLLEQVEFEERQNQRKWGTDGEMLEFARKVICDKGITNRKMLEKADSGLYKVLGNRKLLDSIDFAMRERKWGTDEEVVVFARKLIGDTGIRSKKGLEKADLGLYQVLKKRKLLEQVEFEEKKRKWSSDKEVLGYACKYIEKTGIRSRGGLGKADKSLYEALRKRGLLDSIFREVETQKHREALGQVLEGLEKFGG